MKSFAVLMVALSIGFTATPQVPIAPNNSNRNGANPQGSFDKTRHTIRPGDTLLVRVWRQPHLGRTVIVGNDGRISLPVIGAVAVEGLTIAELAEMYKKGLQAHVDSPTVAVSFAGFAGWPSPSSGI